MRLLAISGSLRAKSSNTTLLSKMAEVAPANVAVTIYESLGDLPHFNSDIEETAPPDIVLELRRRVGEADALVICSPEYAHGVPGVMKNALDWLVGGPEMIDKRVALINANPWSTYAQASLKETITIMSARVIVDAAIDVKRLDDDAITRALMAVIDRLASER